jgi:hypothetical protein
MSLNFTNCGVCTEEKSGSDVRRLCLLVYNALKNLLDFSEEPRCIFVEGLNSCILETEAAVCSKNVSAFV